MHTRSPFFFPFSLRDLIEKNYPWAANPHPSASGAIGGGSGYLSAGKSRHQSSYHQSETFSCHIQKTGEDRFDEAAFIQSFRSLIEKQIIDSQCTVSAQGATGPAEFFFEYNYEDRHGRIDVGGKLVIANYRLTAEINEGSQVASPTTGSKWPFQPQGDYYVLGIRGRSSLRQNKDIVGIGSRLIKESLERRRRAGLSLHNMEYAEVFSLFRVPPEIRRAVEEKRIRLYLELNPDPWEQYEEYEQVYFLNETALRMYRDSGIELEILKTIPAAQLPRQTYRALRVLYFPAE